jgi:hypothetical protein
MYMKKSLVSFEGALAIRAELEDFMAPNRALWVVPKWFKIGEPVT